MAEGIRLTEDELSDLNKHLNSIMIELKNSSSAIFYFFENPIRFLNGYEIKILKYIKNSPKLLRRFEQSLRELIGFFKKGINPCLRCRLAVLFIMFATLGKSHLLWSGIIEVMDKIKDGMIDFFGRTSDDVDIALSRVEHRINLYRASHLAFLICVSLGYCKPIPH